MTVFSTTRFAAHERRRASHLTPVLVGSAITAVAIGFIAYLLWPTWGAGGSSSLPARLPVSIGGTLFNVPTAAIRMKIQRHSGPQERIDLNFSYPSLMPPDAPRHVTAEMVERAAAQPIDRIFLSIEDPHGSLAPDLRVRAIYPRYLDDVAKPLPDGLTVRAFRDHTPYGGEDLFSAEAPALSARCTRDGETPGMCLSERRIDGADLTYRFPRSWLSQWREVAGAMDRLTLELRAGKG